MTDYDEITFNEPDSFLNKPAPKWWITFSIGGVLFIVSLAWWIHRIRMLLRKKEDITTNIFIRILISATIDNDRNLFTMITYCCISFLFLGGIQLNYDFTLIVMLIFYSLSPSLEILRVLLAYRSVDSFDDPLTIVSNTIQDNYKERTGKKIEPKNVYEDLGRSIHIVCMIFATQFILISFVCIDIKETNSEYQCLDGTQGCPIGGTLGSWLFFVLGIFMALVFQFGPSTNFGESEQNPAYWLHLLLEIRNGKTEITWNNDRKHIIESITLQPGDYRVIVRYMMSFLINGIGFHILVHALPLQMASQSSYMGIVATAVGMLYLVDLDDTPGYTLTIKDTDTVNTENTEVTDIDKAVDEVRTILRNLESSALANKTPLLGGYRLASDDYDYTDESV